MKAFKIVLYSVGGFILLCGILLIFVMAGMGEVSKLSISQIDLSTIDDGTYEGKYYKNRWTYDLLVKVEKHRIVEVKNVNKKMEMFKDFNDEAEQEVIAEQSPQIDVVTGASINTKAFSKAVENALTVKNIQKK